MIYRLPEYTSNASHPKWSPDGRLILFGAQEREQNTWGLAYISVTAVVK
jgi:Tol biopolymer transport system component